MELGFPSKFSPQQATRSALRYSHKFGYPLSPDEAWIWQPFTRYSKKQFSDWPYQSNGFLYLPTAKKDVEIRRSREIISIQKYQTARKALGLFMWIPTIKAIYITGSLAMDNCKKGDDIDVMIISSPDSVWITRAVVVTILAIFSLRRPSGVPEHSSVHVSDKICDNLYLSLSNLVIPHHPGFHSRNYYLAHEILQAKLLWGDRRVDRDFIVSNQWVKKYFPVAYIQRSKKIGEESSQIFKIKRNPLIFVLNIMMFLAQYLYMRSGLTVEKVGLEHAFFHPRQNIRFYP